MSGLLLHPQPHPAIDEPQVRTLPDSRPPAQLWSWPPTAARPGGGEQQPTLALALEETPALAPPRPRGHSVHVVSHAWTARAAASLPDAGRWSATLALALTETLQGRRPIGQLSRWVDDAVLAAVGFSLRSRRPLPTSAAATRPAVLRSVRVQCPQPHAVEVSAHVAVAGQSRALAFRLEAWYDRWLCTALELGPHGWGAPK